MDDFVVHKHQKNFEAAVRLLNGDPGVGPENRELIFKFSKVRMAKGVSKTRTVKCIYFLRSLAGMLKKPFDQATKNDLIALVGDVENTNYKETTKYDFKIILKVFYKWLKGNDEAYPAEVNWLRPRMKNGAHKLPEELLTEEEVFKLADAADHPRDKAFVLVLYETGCRIGELLSLKMKNVQFDDYGAVLRVTGKTGDRRVRIISSAPALASWIQVYPFAKNSEAPLWPPLCTNYKYYGQPVEYCSIRALLANLAKKSGVTKSLYPHLFRHSRATALAGKLTEAQMKEYFGWTQSSEMASVYVHLSGRDVDNALLALQGLAKPEDRKEDQLKVCFCPRCREKNSPIAKFCLRCGTPMDAQVMAHVEDEKKNGDELMNALMKDAEFKEFLYKKAAALGFEKRL